MAILKSQSLVCMLVGVSANESLILYSKVREQAKKGHWVCAADEIADETHLHGEDFKLLKPI